MLPLIELLLAESLLDDEPEVGEEFLFLLGWLPFSVLLLLGVLLMESVPPSVFDVSSVLVAN